MFSNILSITKFKQVVMYRYTQYFAVDPPKVTKEIQEVATPRGHTDLARDIIQIFADNGSLGFIFLVLFLSAYFFDLSGFLKDAREGFKNLGRLADSVNKLTIDVERYQRQSNDDIHELNVGLSKTTERIDRLASKIDDLNDKIPNQHR